MPFWAAQASAASPPSIESVSVSGITEHDATLEAQINPNGLETTYEFHLASPACQSEWPIVGPCFAISGFPLPSATIPAGFGDQTVRVDINSAGKTLRPGTWYEYAVTASDADGEVTGYNAGEGPGIGRNFAGGGGEQNFKTLSAGDGQPSIEGESASKVTEHDATLEAQINTYGLYTAYEFQIDTNGSYNYTKPNCPLGVCDSISVGEPLPAGLVEPKPEYIPAESGDRSVSLNLATIGTTLQPGTTYHYKVIASNYSGPTVEGPDQTFTTPEDMVQPPSTNTTTSSPSGADQPAGPSNGGQPAGSGGSSSSSPSSPTPGVGVLGAETGKASEPKPITAPTPTESHVLVSYTVEGGLAYKYSSLVVSTHREATVTRKGQTVRFRLDRARWRKLNAVLKHTDLSAVAGDYPASPGAADYMTYTISVGSDWVRATDLSELPDRVRHEVEPLRQVLEEIVAVGTRRIEKGIGLPTTSDGTRTL